MNEHVNTRFMLCTHLCSRIHSWLLYRREYIMWNMGDDDITRLHNAHRYKQNKQAMFVCMVCYLIIIITKMHRMALNFLKCLLGTTLPIVYLRLSQFSQLSSMQYMGLCVFGLPIFLMMLVRICVYNLVIVINLVVWPICPSLWLGLKQSKIRKTHFGL